MKSANYLNLNIIVLFLIFFSLLTTVIAQNENNETGTLVFYNVENLYDVENDPQTIDDDFLPKGTYGWNPKRYNDKIQNISKVLSKIGEGPDIIGLSEIENSNVLEDLLKTEALNNNNYGFIHFDSPNNLGLDVALIYKKTTFKPLSKISIPIRFSGDSNMKSRDILWVEGSFLNDTIHVIINHWPKNTKKESFNIKAGQTLRRRIDSLQQIDPLVKIVIMGDFNVNPINKSIAKVVGAKGSKLNKGDLFNTSLSSFQDGKGNYLSGGLWQLTDQFIISQSLLKNNHKSIYYLNDSFQIFAPEWLQSEDQEGISNPYPTFKNGVYHGGYSDHFPTFIILSK